MTAWRPGTWAPIALVAVMCAVALARNASVVSGLEWPGLEIDYREMAAAQTLTDQGFGPDSTYRGERIWYNPLSAALAAAGSRLSGVPLRAFIPRVAPWLNLLAPAALCSLVLVLAGDAWAAAAATAAFLFMTGTNLPFYYSATYSPWFAPENYGQGLFYLALIVLYRSLGRPPSAWRDAVVGAFLGVIFLCHTAPALLLGGILLVLAAIEWGEGKATAAGVSLLRRLGVAVIVSSPFIFEIAGAYHLRIVNPFPTLSPSDILDPNGVPTLALTLSRLPAAAAAVALVGVARRAKREAASRILAAWIAVAAGYIAYNYARVYLAVHAGATLPLIVPAFHFLFYVMAWVSVGFGLALAAFCELIESRYGWKRGIVAPALIVVLVAAHVPSYLRRPDFTRVSDDVRRLAGLVPVPAYEWLRASTTVNDVFLSTDEASLLLIAPAGRHVVATERYFSNPYVDWTARSGDRYAMFSALKGGDLATFERLASKYDVRYVVVPGKAFDWLTQPEADAVRPFVTAREMPGDRFREAFAVGDLAIFEVLPRAARN